MMIPFKPYVAKLIVKFLECAQRIYNCSTMAQIYNAIFELILQIMSGTIYNTTECFKFPNVL